jgi:WD40 repeat protein
VTEDGPAAYPSQMRLSSLTALVAVALLAAAGCGGDRTETPYSTGPDAAELRVVEVHVPGAPFAIEGEITYLRLERADGGVVKEATLPNASEPPFRVAVEPGRYTLAVWHRTCDGNCGYLDPPSDRCRAGLDLRPGSSTEVTIENSPGSDCRAVTRSVDVALVYARAIGLDANDGWIWRARPDGTQAVRLTRGTSPVLAPDGLTIAFVRYRSAPRAAELYAIASGGGSPRLLRRVTGEDAFVGGIAWSPDSRRLAVVEGRSLVLVDADGGRARRFASPAPAGSPDQPSFSPDGSAVVYARFDRTGADLYVYDERSGRTRRLTRDHVSLQPLWGPESIAFARIDSARGDVWLVDAYGRGLRRLTHTRAGIVPAAWSADGRRLLAANPATHNGRLWAVEVPSGRARDLTGWVADLFAQGLSRDGTTILAAIGCGALVEPVGIVETLPFSGGKPRVIVRGPCRASWNR